MSQTFLLGMNAKIYQGAAGGDLASLTEMSNVKDVTLNLEAGEADVTTRGNQGWRATAPTLRECTVEFEMLWNPGDAGFEAIKTAFLSSGTLRLAVKEQLGVDLLQPEAGDPPLLTRLGTDEMLLGEVLCAMLQQQFETQGVTAEEVRDGFDGQTLLAAQKAFYEELIDFFRSRGRTDHRHGRKRLEHHAELALQAAGRTVGHVRRVGRRGGHQENPG